MARPAFKESVNEAPPAEVVPATPPTLKERIGNEVPTTYSYDNGIQPSADLIASLGRKKEKIAMSWKERQSQGDNVVDINTYRSAKAPKIKPLSQESSKNSIKGWLRGLFNV